ncbi:hypothetical protein EI164_16005 [Psychrobacter sp. FME13]|uniref:hypothetical protein n=1 Tax=unclassified Psychrobacter TaxID=196806 RepID=UPI00178854D3|nr:hypothetical protein [Psychrobacter sp. FME13]MBE0443516.1 hypothetical protein [Psychrobacter sp. FME13]
MKIFINVLFIIATLSFTVSCKSSTVEQTQSMMESKNEEELIDSWMEDKLITKSNYYRDYSTAHLNKNTQQIVQSILIEFWKVPLEAKNVRSNFGFTDGLEKGLIHIYVKYKHLPKWYMQVGQCTKDNKGLYYQCVVDGDAGQFSIKFIDNKLQVKGHIRMNVCGVVWEDVGSKLENASSPLSDDWYKGNEVFMLDNINEIPLRLKSEITNCRNYG